VNTFIKSGLFLLIFATLAFSQSNELLTLSVNKEGTDNKPVSVTLRLQADNTFSNGFYIELPKGIKTVIRSIKRDDQELWLVESEQPPQQDNVVAWYTKNNGLFLQYNENLLAIPSQLQIELVPDNKRLQRIESFNVRINAAERKAGKLEKVKNEFARSEIKIKTQRTQQDEE
jgi:hypothetical protein